MSKKNNSFSVFFAMVQRDLIAQWRDKGEFVFRVVMLPTVLIITYGYVLPHIGLLPDTFLTQMFAGMIGMSILITGIHGTAIPFTMDFNNMHEIEDRLQAPVSAVFMGTNLDFTLTPERIMMLIPILLLIAFASATLGLLVGTIVKPMQIAAMFPGFLMPMVFSGAIFFSWKGLSEVPVFQKLVLVNPLVYANEALRYVLTPQIDSMAIEWSVLGLIISILIMGYFGFKRFHRMVIS